jgi:hypothetical protein
VEDEELSEKTRFEMEKFVDENKKPGLTPVGEEMR